MNKKIQELNWDKLLSLDIESCRGVEVFDESHPHWDVWAWRCRDKDTCEIPDSLEVIKQYYQKAALSAEWGKIVCISVGYVKDEKLFTKSFTGDEKQILQDVVNMIKKSGRMLLGHNLIGFDIQYLRKRFFINGLKDYLTESQGNDVYTKPWLLDECIFDTMVAYKGSGYVNTSLDELAMCFNIPTPKGEMHGNEVGDYYYSGRISEIKRYCEGDVATVINIVRAWRGESILEIEGGVPKELPKDERTLLQRIYDDRELSGETKGEIKKLTSKAKLTKKDKANLFVILRGVLIREAFEFNDQDNKATIQQKEEQITNLINEL